jgi:hypothetical protein
MTSQNSNSSFKLKRPSLLALTLVCSSILLLTAGSLVLCSCAHTEKGLAREQLAYNVTSNAVAYLQPVAAAAPAPINTLLEGLLASGGALLALWASHIHRSVAELKTGGSPAPGPVPPEAPKTA